MMINDVARAFFEADAKRPLCVELPDEAREEEEEDCVALLKKSLYGTRDAAANFQAEVTKFMRGIGFEVGKYNVCTYYHRSRQLRTLVHGDDFVTVGDRAETEWFKKRLEERFEIKTKKVGDGPGENREEKVLNRIIRITPEGWEYEADQRHGELVVQGMGLEEAKSVSTPGEDLKSWQEEEDRKAR